MAFIKTPCHPVDWVLFKHNLASPDMRDVFNERNFIEKILKVEVALAEAEAELGIIPEKAAREIAKKASIEYIDLEKVEQRVQKTGHFLVAIIESWREKIGETGEFLHWGATTQDISDTAMILLIKDACDLILRDLFEIKGFLVDLAKKYKDTPMAGRTHCVHAVPMTFGLKVGVWLDEISRHIERLKEIQKRLFVGNITGAVGTFASFGPKGPEIQKLTLRKLGLEVPAICWHAARDRLAEFLNLLAIIASTLSKIANQVLILMRPEILEIEEPIPPGHVGSSTMPQKRNPFLSETSVALARIIRAHAHIMTESMETLDERNFSTWFVEFVIIPECCLFLSIILKNLKTILQKLEVHPENMRRNLEISEGLINAEAVMMALAPKIGRQKAHHIVYDCAMKAQKEKKPFRDVLLENETITKHISKRDLEKLLDPASYIGLSSDIVKQLTSSENM
ncbi:MAG: adenylosuccinate lyase [Candidatus Bathyarchaeia archaeon]